MTVSDFIWEYLADAGVEHVFFLPGGGCMYLVDALARQDRITPVACLHEQGAAIAACGYAEYRNHLGVCLVTSGPGGTNAITAVASAWIDSVPLLVISGQVPFGMRRRPSDKERQKGPQEVDILRGVTPWTKYQLEVRFPRDVFPGFENAVQCALVHPRGPTWVDICLDVQGAKIG